MNDYVKTFDGFGKLLKFLFALPVINITWMLYRILKSAINKNTVGIISGVVLTILVFPMLVLSIIDMVTIIFGNVVLWIE